MKQETALKILQTGANVFLMWKRVSGLEKGVRNLFLASTGKDFPPAGQSNEKKGILGRMKFYLRRWWIVNRLYHFTRGVGSIWVDEQNFIDWVIGKSVSEKPVYWYRLPPSYNLIHRLGSKFLLDFREEKTRRREVRNLVAECEDKRVGWIERPEPEFIELLDGRKIQKNNDGITVSVLGIEKYAVSHLINRILSNSWVRAIGTGVIVALVVWYTTERVNNLIPKEPVHTQVEYSDIKASP